jgi:hypothetical protein
VSLDAARMQSLIDRQRLAHRNPRGYGGWHDVHSAVGGLVTYSPASRGVRSANSKSLAGLALHFKMLYAADVIGVAGFHYKSQGGVGPCPT